MNEIQGLIKKLEQQTKKLEKLKSGELSTNEFYQKADKEDRIFWSGFIKSIGVGLLIVEAAVIIILFWNGQDELLADNLKYFVGQLAILIVVVLNYHFPKGGRITK